MPGVPEAWLRSKPKGGSHREGLWEDEQRAKGLNSSSCLNLCENVQHCSLCWNGKLRQTWGICWASSTHIHTSTGSKILCKIIKKDIVLLESTAAKYREQGELGGLSQSRKTKDTISIVQENGFPVRNGIYSRKNMCIYVAYYKYLSIPIEMCKHTNVKAL